MSMARLLFLAGATLHGLVFPAIASGQCVSFDTPEDLFARAEVVFAGTVVATEPTGATGAHAIVDLATVRVERSWKGRLARDVRVGADRPFEIEKRYVVFAAGTPLSTSILCRWAEPEERAKATLDWLDMRALADDFAGKWEVTSVIEKKGGGFEWSLEIKYPKYMTLELRDGRLVGRYTDQWDFSSDFALVAVINQGRDLLLVHGGAGTKEPTALSPIHHVKLVKGKLHAVVTSHDKLFEWVAERK